VGKFISEDSIEFDGNDGNLYRYVENNPVNGVDPTGELTIPNPLRSLSSALPFNPFDLAEQFIPGLRDNTIYRSLTSNIQVAAGEEFAQQSQCWYAQHYVDPSTPNWQRPLYFVGGVLSSLWTPENSDATFAVLSTALTLSGAAARTEPRIGGRGPAPIEPRPLPAPTTPTSCFIAATEILTVDGEKNIEDIQVGDWVMANDPTTPGDIRAKQVLQTFVREASSVVDLYIDGEVITVTDEHPFWVPDQGWVAAKELHNGTVVQTENGAIVDVDRVERRQEHVKVYNFEVEGFHTYFVSDLGILVHNTCFNVDDRVAGQLQDPRMGSLQGRLSNDDIRNLLNTPDATRVLDARSGHINVIQEVEGRLVRITVPRDEAKIISVGPIRHNQVTNLIGRGDFILLP